MDFTGSYEGAVRERAYEIYLLRQKFSICGNPVSDWLTAERDWRSAATRRTGVSVRAARADRRRTVLA